MHWICYFGLIPIGKKAFLVYFIHFILADTCFFNLCFVSNICAGGPLMFTYWAWALLVQVLLEGVEMG